MRISDWSSDVCSSDLGGLVTIVAGGAGGCVNAHVAHLADDYDFPDPVSIENLLEVGLEEGIGEVLHDNGFIVTRPKERRVGKVCVLTCSSRWLQVHSQKKPTYI